MSTSYALFWDDRNLLGSYDDGRAGGVKTAEGVARTGGRNLRLELGSPQGIDHDQAGDEAPPLMRSSFVAQMSLVLPGTAKPALGRDESHERSSGKRSSCDSSATNFQVTLWPV
jgi:hypothetical protein